MNNSARGYYEMTDRLKETLEANPLINTVTYGNLHDAGNDKTTMFPLAHFTVNSTELTAQTFIFNMTLFVADLIDHTNEVATDKFRGNKNTMDVHNSMLAAISEAMLIFRRKDAMASGYALVGNPNIEAFEHRFNADAAGWFCDFTVEVTQRMGVGC
tara:strand:- start:1354 stop:1824 length:471 start_codon:yes stop_codon:yes gene_type:complete